MVGLLVAVEVGFDRTMGRYDPALWHVGAALAWARFSFDRDSDPGSATAPSSDPLVETPLFVLDGLTGRSLPCHGWRNENVVPSERRCSGLGSGASTATATGASLEGVIAGGVILLSIPKVNGFDTPLAPAGEAAALRLFRCNLFAE